MFRILTIATLAPAFLFVEAPAVAQRIIPVAESPAPAPLPDYADYASLVLRSPLIIDVTVRNVSEIKGPEAVGVATGFGRFYLEADVLALVRGSEALPKRLGYVADLPLDAKGRPPKLSKMRALLFARTLPGRPDMVQLAALDGQRRWTPETDALVRRIAQEVVATDAPPMIIGVGNAFHVPGSLPGEGETQIFLTTKDGRPVSLSILRRPGESPRWAVALSEIVDEAAKPPERNTLLWYRLACSLPAKLPDSSVAGQADADATVAREDYALVVDSLGKCRRQPLPAL